MILEFKNNPCFEEIKDVLIRDGKQLLKIFYGSNFDLYIDIFGDYSIDENDCYSATFAIDHDQELYKYFESLVDNIINCNIFDAGNNEPEKCNTEEQMNESLKIKSVYNLLIQDSIITWYSDNIYEEKANKLRIEKKDNKIILTFIDNPDDPTFGFGIRICNSGSKYEPFNLCFMNLFNQLQALNKNENQKKLVIKDL